MIRTVPPEVAEGSTETWRYRHQYPYSRHDGFEMNCALLEVVASEFEVPVDRVTFLNAIALPDTGIMAYRKRCSGQGRGSGGASVVFLLVSRSPLRWEVWGGLRRKVS